jgi:hypothetical protein
MDEPYDIAKAVSRFLLIGKVKSTTLICLS